MTELAPPKRYVVPRPAGDPSAARQLAAAYDALADALVAQLRVATGVLRQLDAGWRGAGAAAAERPESVLSADCARIVQALRHSAADLRHFAHKLQQAHDRHGWSIGRLVTLGAMVTVGVAAVVVTVGAAAPAEAAAAAAAVESAEAAAGAAGTAASSTAGSLVGWQSLLAAVRPLAPFVVPHLISAGVSTGLEAGTELVSGDSLDLHALEVAAAIGFTGSATGREAERLLSRASTMTRRGVEAASWAANGTAGGYADGEDVTPVDSVAFGLTGFVARDVRKVVDDVWARATGSGPTGELVDEL